MNIEEQKITIKKLMRDSLSEDERFALNENSQVKKYMQRQWADAAEESLFDSEHPNGERIWKKVTERIWQERSERKVVFYKIYSLVASILLILGISSMVYLLSKKSAPEMMYVIASGIRSIESVNLPDGTEVQLGSGSRLSYPAKFNAQTREIYLDGQAFFDVAKDWRRPFIVHTNGMDVQALGTAFEVFSYEIESNIETILLNGKIQVTMPDRITHEVKKYILSPNEKIQYNKNDGVVAISTVNANKYTAWRQYGVMSFENEKLSMIIPRLEQWYGRKIICQKDVAEQFRFTFKVKDESLERILFMLSQSSILIYEKMDNGNYIVKLSKKTAGN